VPKLGMGPIRREQICRAASTVIAREGFAGTTMRMVAEEAGVSTGMLNHYFVNRQDLLVHALEFVSERAHARMVEAIADLAAGRERLVALLDCVLAGEPEMTETWRVWIAAYGEAVRLPELRRAIESRLSKWYELLDTALEGVVPATEDEQLTWSRRLDTILNGLALRALTAEEDFDRQRIREETIGMLLHEVPVGG
jgi:TetR/AcrR family transcriptional regulator, transcriptional repressor of bet genes